MRALVAAGAVLPLLTAPVMACMVCSPTGNATRVLASPAPNDIHPDWAGQSYIGTGWYVEQEDLIKDGQFIFIRGHLFSPRGGDQGEVFGLLDEWECSRH